MERRGSSTIHGEIISFEPPGNEGRKSRDEELELQFLKEKGVVVTDTGPTFGKRHLEVISYFLLVFINQCMRQHLSITIVAMTDPTANKNKNIPTFDWTNKNVILSSFFWGYIGPQILTGWLASRYGPKWFIVGSTGVSALLGLLTPWLAVHLGSTSVIASRALQGVAQSFMVPSTSYFFSRWVPTSERARSSAFVLSATSFATIVSMSVSGPIAASQYGWPMIFYIFSTLGFAWCIYYAIFGCDSPVQHKSITEEEKIFIIKTVVDSTKKQPKTPWRKILTSVPFWALMYSNTCSILIIWTFLSEIPSYMNKIMKFNINSNGLLTSLIYVTQWVNSLIISTTSDYLTNNNYLSTTVARKLFAAFGMVGSGTVLLFLAQCTEENSTKGVILLMIAVGALGANNCSLGINTLDLAPDHAGILQGFVNGFSHIFAVLAPLIVQFIVHDESDPEQWKRVFYLIGSTSISAALVFALLGTAKKQSWNDAEDEDI